MPAIIMLIREREALLNRAVEIQVSDEILAALRQDPQAYAADLRLAAAAKMYELGQVSQELGADIAGLSRRDFLFALGRFRVSPFQDTPDSLKEELARG